MSLTSKLLAIVTAAILLVFAVPNFIGAFWMAIGGETVFALSEGETATPEQIEEAIETRHAALAIAPRAKSSADLALLYLKRGQTAENYQLAIDALEDSLEMEPLSAYRWLTLSAVLAGFPERQTEAAEAWRTSRALSVHDSLLWHQRIAVGIQLYQGLTPADQAALVEDAEMAYRRNRNGFRHFARQYDLLEWAKFLLNDPEKTAFLSR